MSYRNLWQGYFFKSTFVSLSALYFTVLVLKCGLWTNSNITWSLIAWLQKTGSESDDFFTHWGLRSLSSFTPVLLKVGLQICENHLCPVYDEVNTEFKNKPLETFVSIWQSFFKRLICFTNGACICIFCVLLLIYFYCMM